MERNKIKVYLQYPWKFPDSPYYKYLIESPPKDVKFLNAKKQKGVITSKKFFLFSNMLKKYVKKSARYLTPSLPNSHESPNGDYDLIHCAHCLSRNKNKPWIADIEYASQMWVAGSTPNNNKRVKKLLLSRNCKKIISWTERMKYEILTKFPEIRDKVSVVYPGIPVLGKKRKHNGINLSFVARYFYKKGGLHALEAIDILTKKYGGVNGIVVADVPKELIERYSENKKIKFYDMMSQKELIKKVYSITDIFIYPGYSDSFGFAIPEVMGMGIPVVSVNGPSRKEIILNKNNGFVIDTKLNQWALVKNSENSTSKESKRLINEIISKTSKLISDKNLLRKFSRNAKREIGNGKFSIKNQRKSIGEIYMEALND